MSTYITALCAGPYHEVRDTHDGIDLGVFCRPSMAQYLDADDLFLITKQGFDFFHEQFGVRYPLPKYDQLWVPDFNAGAMENFGCVTHAESHYIFRSQVTDFEYEQRANTILHEMAHMWFGDLVTMRWWDDLWLNESFAEWASHWCNTERDPVHRRVDDVPVDPQELGLPPGPALLHPPGLLRDARRGGGRGQLRRHHVRQGRQRHQAARRVRRARRLRRPACAPTSPQHAWGNATFDDLLSALEAASGRELREFAAQWLETAQVNTLRPGGRRSATDGTYAVGDRARRRRRPATRRCAPTASASASTTCDGDRLVRRERLEIDVDRRAHRGAAAGRRAAPPTCCCSTTTT